MLPTPTTNSWIRRLQLSLSLRIHHREAHQLKCGNNVASRLRWKFMSLELSCVPDLNPSLMIPLVPGLGPRVPPKCHSPSQMAVSNLHQQALEGVQLSKAEPNLIKRQRFGERVCQQNRWHANSTTFYDTLQRVKKDKEWENAIQQLQNQLLKCANHSSQWYWA